MSRKSGPFWAESRVRDDASGADRAAWEKLRGLRAELADLAFDLERRGRADAADVAGAVAARVGELLAEMETREDDARATRR